ncbi:MAG: glycosyltransferase family 2 protein [Alistipes sp.]|nr:glycosyltransferase family 2 protein [Alistipes sp.]MDE6861384.1 glycosyltransferase family 2 protein [Alistipes sp.]
MSSLSVVILNWNGIGHLRRFLGSVVENTPAEVDIVVADNGSTDESVAWIERNHRRVKILRLDRNYGFAEGYNRALRQIDSRYYILLNSDVEVTPGWTQPLAAMLDSAGDIAAVAPKLLSWEHRDRFEYAGASGGFIDILGYPFCRGRILSNVEVDDGQYDSPREVFWASGAAMACRADVFHALGGFDADFFAHMEEIDLCWRMQLAGYRIMVEPRSVVYHLGGGTLPVSPRKLYLNHRNNLAMIFKCASVPQRIACAVIRPLCDGAEAAGYLLCGRVRNAWAVVSAWGRFVAWHGTLAGKRRAVIRRKKPFGIYRGSIVLRYIFAGKRFDNIM